MKELDAIYFAARELSPENRPAYLAKACGGDSALRSRVEQMLAVAEEAEAFITDLPDAGSAEQEAARPLLRDLKPEPADARDEFLGQKIGPYKILESLGEGGCGAVYVAEQTEPVRRRVALKVIRLGMDTKQVVARFGAERQALAMMDHPNIAKIFDAGTTETGRPYFVMELVRGIRITDYCDQASLSTKERLDLFIQVCQAILHAHQKGIIHRDIKPSNILVTLHDGVPVPKVIDFGIAKATEGRLTDGTVYTRLHQFIGTPAYMSPEQAEMSGLDIDTRSDIYSLGILLYELLTGCPPFDMKELLKRGFDAAVRTIREVEPPRPSTRLNTLQAGELATAAKLRAADGPKLIRLLRGDLDWIVMKCLEKDRTRRYDTANGLAADLKRFLENEPVMARPPSAAYRFQKLIRRKRRAALGIVAVAVAIVAGTASTNYAFLRERKARLKHAAAEHERNTESIRAEAVAKFMDDFLRQTLPGMHEQGNIDAASAILEAADQLAVSVFSNAPVAEMRLRHRMAHLYRDTYSAEELRQWDRILDLAKTASPNDVPEPPLLLKIYRAASETNGMPELQVLEETVRREVPPRNLELAWCLAFQGYRHLHQQDLKNADLKLAEAFRIVPRGVSLELEYFIGECYSRAFYDRGAWTDAERIARSTLLPVEKLPDGLYVKHAYLLQPLYGSLCAQLRFAEAAELVHRQAQQLRATGCPMATVLKVEKLRGKAIARSGDAKAASALLSAIATNASARVSDVSDAAIIALGTGDTNTYQRLCWTALTRFASGANRSSAFFVGEILLLQPQDESVMFVANALLNRLSQAENYSKGLEYPWITLACYREGRYVEALKTLDEVPKISSGIIRIHRQMGMDACSLFVRAMLYAQLGRLDEARTFYASGAKALGPPPSAQQPRDLGEYVQQWFAADVLRREAEAVLKVKGEKRE